MQKCRIVRPDEYERHYVGIEQSNCYQHAPISIGTLMAEIAARGQEPAAHLVRIVVTTTVVDLHQHEGWTMVLVTEGEGVLRTEDGDIPVNQWDWIVIPPRTKHLSIGDMVEIGIYVSHVGDRQDYYE